MKIKILSTLALTAVTAVVINAQNWQYVGNPYINQTAVTTISSADMEINSAGDVLVGYSAGLLKFAKYSGGSWTQLASPDNDGAVNTIDIEVRGTEFYMSYSKVKGTNYYIYVKKYSGASWTQIGDSVLLGYIGNGSYYDFLLDNNGVPTLVGISNTAGKQVLQYNGSTWAITCTIAGSASSVCIENSATFDAQNKLYCLTSGFATLTVPPYVVYSTLVNKIDGSNRTIVGDTIFNGVTTNNKIKIDANGIPYLCFNATSLSRVMAYKLNGASWKLIADTTTNIGNMYCADITSSGKVVFYTLGTSVAKKVYYYNNGSLTAMDTLNISGFGVGAVYDLVIPAGSNDAYVLVLETKPSALSDLSVMKHTVSGSSSAITKVVDKDMTISIFPNPAKDEIRIESYQGKFSQICIFDITGKLMIEKEIIQNNNLVDVSGLTRGVYFVLIKSENRVNCKKLMIQ